MIEEIIINIQHELSESLSENQMKQLLASLRRHLSVLNAQASIDSESQMSNWLPLFISAKRVEGCSEKSLRYYESTIRNMLEKINKLGIGPHGFGGKTTALALNIETLPTHIAGMPCAVNINCHVTRHKTEVI